MIVVISFIMNSMNIVIILFLCSSIAYGQATVTFSEIMFDAATNESHDEFIELFNLSYDDSFSVEGWEFSDSSGTVLHTTAALPLMAPADTVDVSGEVVFAGYGYMNSQENYNDFADISLNGRIVIIMTRKPNLRGSGMPDPKSGISEMPEVRKVPMIMMQKAKAILYVADPALGSDISSDLLSMGGSYQLTPLFRKQLFNFALNAYTISTTSG